MPLPIGSPCSAAGCAALAVAKSLCAKHYKRWQRYGDVEVVNRPNTWGRKEKHPLYGRWVILKRYHSDSTDVEWLLDFWRFVDDVGEQPDGTVLRKLDKAQKFSKANACWVAVKGAPTGRKDSAAYYKDWHVANPRASKSMSLKYCYGIGIDEYEKLLDAQEHKCAICGKQESATQSNGKTFRLAVDHCHESKKIRGLLCSRCNRGLGYFSDNTATLLSAVEYLTASKK